MIELEPHLVIGKARTGDFAVLLPANLTMTSSEVIPAASWLHVQAANAVRRSVALWRQDGRTLVGYGWQQSGTDPAGRPLYRLIVFLPRANVPQGAHARLMLWLYRQDFDADAVPRFSVDPAGLVDDDAQLLADDFEFGAASLALGLSDVCRAQNTRTAQAIVDALGYDQIGFVALVPNAVPSWRGGGAGVVISRSPWWPPPEAVRLVGRGVRPGALDLSGLMRMPRDRVRRQTLALAAVDGDCAPLGTLSDEEFAWLIGQELARVSALAQANAEQIARVYGTIGIPLAVLDRLTPEQLRGLPPGIVAKALRGRPDAVSRFVEIFGRGCDAVEALLPERVAALVHATRDTTFDVERISDITDTDLELMDLAGILDTMPLRWLAALWAIRRRPPTNKHLAHRMRELLPEPLASRLLGVAQPDQTILPATTPPDPRADWLAKIPFEHLVDAGSLCMKSRLWRHWWVEAVRAHPGSRMREIATLAAPWSRETAAWLAASARDGEISANEVSQRVATFMAERAPIQVSDLADLLGAAGVAQADAMAHVAQGRNPSQCMVDQRFAADMCYLADVGILTNDAIRDALRDGLPVAALSRFAADPTAIVLLDEHAFAPSHAPTSWHSVLDQELRRRMREPSFWSRWPRGVPVTLRNWMQERAGNAPESAIIAALSAAGERSRVLDIAELKLLGGGLAPLDLAWQVIQRCRHGQVDRSEVMALLSRSKLRPEFVVFLQSELALLAPAAPVPELSVPELAVAQPLLHPVRDIVRQIMSRLDIEPDEDRLLRDTVAAVRQLGYFIPPPPPSAAQAARRPAWVSALSELPGWEDWRQTQSQEPRLGA
jgi:hypothetical protein